MTYPELKNIGRPADKDLANSILINSFFTYQKTVFVILTLVFLSPDISCQFQFPSAEENAFSSPVYHTIYDNHAELIESAGLRNGYFSNVDDTILSKTDQFYDTLRNIAGKRRITREILDLIIVKPSQENGNIAMVSETPYIEYDNKIIRSIRFKQLDVFGPTITDTTLQAKRSYEKTGNRLHIHTSRNILQKNLLFKTGDRLNVYTLADNERIIRALPYINDVKILVKEIHPSSDSVDVIIITKDLWSFGFGFDLSGINKGRLSVWDRNLFGFGREQQNTVFWDADKKPLLGYEGIYRINNLAGSFINTEFRFMSFQGTQQYLADFQRSFFTPEIKYAGGFRFENIKTIKDIQLFDTTLLKTPYANSNYDFWIGSSFHIKKDNRILRERTNIMFAGRIFSIFYHVRPEVSKDYLYVFHDRLQFIGSAALSNQGFYKSRLIYGFGPTEDIPFGYLVQLTGGFEINEYKNRPYLGLSVSNGMYLKKRGGYLYNKFELGGFLRNRAVEQGILGLTTKYFTPLFSYNRFKVRYFINFNYTAGIHRYPEEFVTIQNKEGLFGLTSDILKGTQKMTINFEAVTFTPYYFLGFRFALFGFVDMGLVGPGKKWIFDNSLYSGMGVGIRLRNERLVFNTLQLKFTYYPVIPEDSEWHFIQASGEQRLMMDNFYISVPKFIEY